MSDTQLYFAIGLPWLDDFDLADCELGTGIER